MNDQELLDRLKLGEPLAFDHFYRAYARQVLGWAIRLGGPGLDPEDVAQDVFTVALRRVHTFRGEARITTWLFAVTRNVIANARRRAALRKFVGLSSVEDLPSGGPSADEQLDRLRQRAQVQAALEQVGNKHREVLVLMDLEQRTAPEVAEMLGVPVGTVYSRLHYARRTFAKVLERRGLGSEQDDALPNGVASSGRRDP